jgi:hypothetical protein
MRRSIASVFLSLSLVVSLAAISQQRKTPLSFAVIGDSGKIGSGQTRIAEQMNGLRDKKGFDFVLMLGDNIYPNGVGRGLQANFETPFASLLEDGVEFYAVLGNHDIRNGEELQLGYDKFNMNGQNYYSFTKDNGLIEFFALDSTALDGEIDALEKAEIEQLKKDSKELRKLQGKKKLSPDQAARLQAMEAEIDESQEFLDHREAIVGRQIPWLKKELADSTARWKVVFLHHSIYSSAYLAGGHGKSSRVLKIRALLEPVLVENNVDVVFSGHDHTYERTDPLPESGGGHQVQYFVQGASSKIRKNDLDRTSSFFAAGEDSKHSFLFVQANRSMLYVQAIDEDGEMIDHHVIHRTPPVSD